MDAIKTDTTSEVTEVKEKEDSAKKTATTSKSTKKAESAENKATAKATSSSSVDDKVTKEEVKEDITPAAEVKEDKILEPKEISTDKVEETKSDELAKADDRTEATAGDTDNTLSVTDSNVYPFTVNLTRALSVFRGPSTKVVGKSFGGKITVVGTAGTEFYRVTFVRSGLGLVEGYMLRKEVDGCRS